MNQPDLLAYLLGRIRSVQEGLGLESAASLEGSALFADLLDSMAMTEFLTAVAGDCRTSPGTIEQCAHHRLSTVAALAERLASAGIFPTESTAAPLPREAQGERTAPQAFLAGAAACLPAAVQPAAEINRILNRPDDWLQRHAGIIGRRVWAQEDPLAAALQAATQALMQGNLTVERVDALLVTSEAPPLLAGLGAALHARLRLPSTAVALEVGGASAGFLMALWTGQALLAQNKTVLLVAVEAPSRYLRLQPGDAGEAAALFGDAAAAAVLCRTPSAGDCLAVHRIVAGADGNAAHLLQLQAAPAGGVELHMKGIELAGRAVNTMAENVTRLVREHAIAPGDLTGVIAHGGNGRMPALLARKLGLAAERVWSTTPRTGNLGSASLPVTWALHHPKPAGLLAWTSVGAGLVHGAALMERAR